MRNLSPVRRQILLHGGFTVGVNKKNKKSMESSQDGMAVQAERHAACVAWVNRVHRRYVREASSTAEWLKQRLEAGEDVWGDESTVLRLMQAATALARQCVINGTVGWDKLDADNVIEWKRARALWGDLPPAFNILGGKV